MNDYLKLVPLAQVPHISLDLVQWLEALYPPRCKSITEPVEIHMLYAGAVAVSQSLRKHYDVQQERLRVMAEGGETNDPSPPKEPRGRPSVPRKINQ